MILFDGPGRAGPEKFFGGPGRAGPSTKEDGPGRAGQGRKKTGPCTSLGRSQAFISVGATCSRKKYFGVGRRSPDNQKHVQKGKIGLILVVISNCLLYLIKQQFKEN